MKFEPEISSTSIVLLGAFNPAIFQPAWLRAHGVEENPDEDVDVKIIHTDIAQFDIGARNYLVEAGRFQIQSQSAPWVTLADIVRQIFEENLKHTPIHSFGINRHIHFNLPTGEDRMRLGRELAPVKPWGEFGEQLENEDPELAGGLQRLVMRRPQKADGATVHTNVTVEPSGQLRNVSGVYMQVNSHHTLEGLPEGHGCLEAVAMLTEKFETVVEEADTIFDWIMRKGSEG